LARLSARLWIGRGRPAAKAWIDVWLADLSLGEPYLRTLLHTIRMALFESYLHPDDPSATAIQMRAKEIAEAVARASAAVTSETHAALKREEASGEARTELETRYQSAASLLDNLMNQLYFGSGTFRRSGSGGDEDAPGLTNTESKRRFLEDYSEILDIVGQAGATHTLHHLLQVYGYVADAAPGPVFDRLSELWVGQARREGYHYESLGSDALVRLVRRYLADHREIFEDAKRREQLVAVLELFSSAGWPEALKLLYDLPDLLR
jgi:hypothetical protein